MLCIGALMISALYLGYEVGYGGAEHPIILSAVALIMMWGAFRLIGGMEDGKRN